MISDYVNDWLTIIETMQNENTYKLAWGRSILETIGEKEINDDIVILFDELSPKIIKYYWNQIYFFNLKQGSNRTPEIVTAVNEMIKKYQTEHNSNIPVWYEKAEAYFMSQKEYYKKMITRVSITLTKDVSWRFMRSGDNNLELYVLDRKKRMIRFTKKQAEQLKEYRYILTQLLNYRWAQLLEQFNTAPRIASKVKGLSNAKLKRNSLTKFKNILLESFDEKPVDFYTGKILQENDITVDHVIPWSFMYSDDIWNLVLTSRSNNSKKSNTIPTENDIEQLKQRNRELLYKSQSSAIIKSLQESIDNGYVDKFYASIRA